MLQLASKFCTIGHLKACSMRFPSMCRFCKMIIQDCWATDEKVSVNISRIGKLYCRLSRHQIRSLWSDSIAGETWSLSINLPSNVRCSQMEIWLPFILYAQQEMCQLMKIQTAAAALFQVLKKPKGGVDQRKPMSRKGKFLCKLYVLMWSILLWLCICQFPLSSVADLCRKFQSVSQASLHLHCLDG